MFSVKFLALKPHLIDNFLNFVGYFFDYAHFIIEILNFCVFNKIFKVDWFAPDTCNKLSREEFANFWRINRWLFLAVRNEKRNDFWNEICDKSLPKSDLAYLSPFKNRISDSLHKTHWAQCDKMAGVLSLVLRKAFDRRPSRISSIRFSCSLDPLDTGLPIHSFLTSQACCTNCGKYSFCGQKEWQTPFRGITCRPFCSLCLYFCGALPFNGKIDSRLVDPITVSYGNCFSRSKEPLDKLLLQRLIQKFVETDIGRTEHPAVFWPF